MGALIASLTQHGSGITLLWPPSMLELQSGLQHCHWMHDELCFPTICLHRVFTKLKTFCTIITEGRAKASCGLQGTAVAVDTGHMYMTHCPVTCCLQSGSDIERLGFLMPAHENKSMSSSTFLHTDMFGQTNSMFSNTHCQGARALHSGLETLLKGGL